MKLTQEEKRIKIAEACGVPTRQVCQKCQGEWRTYECEKCDQNGMVEANTPDYFNDLNACHEMEKHVKGIGVPFMDEQARRWFDTLIGVCFKAGEHTFTVCATAAQRAEAFGLTLNLWTPEL